MYLEHFFHIDMDLEVQELFEAVRTGRLDEVRHIIGSKGVSPSVLNKVCFSMPSSTTDYVEQNKCMSYYICI